MVADDSIVETTSTYYRSPYTTKTITKQQRLDIKFVPLPAGLDALVACTSQQLGYLQFSVY